jgi:rubrerythrin
MAETLKNISLKYQNLCKLKNVNQESSWFTFYQKASKVALSEGFKDVSELFENIRKVEVKHKKIFEYMYDGYKNGTLYKSDNKKHYVCPSCGHEMFGTKPEEVCPLCKAKMDTFTILLPPSLAF